MGSDNNNLSRKLCLAILAAVQRKYPEESLPGRVGLTDDDADLPHWSVHVPDSREIIQGSGTELSDVEVKVKTDGDAKSDDGSPTDHYGRESGVFDSILTDPQSDFVADLNTSGVDNFTAFCMKEVGRSSGLEGRAFVSTLKLQVICCGSKIS